MHTPETRRIRGDDGAIMAEFALVVPIITLLALGLMEFGMGYQSRNNVESAVQIAARTDANQGKARTADQNAVLAFTAGFARAKRTVPNFMIVYKVTTSGTAAPPPAGCLSTARGMSKANTVPMGINGSCNIYSRAQIAAAPSTVTGFAGAATCDPATAWDKFWCPTARIKALASPDYLGVYVEADYSTLTKVPGSSTLTFTDYAIYRLEPDPTS